MACVYPTPLPAVILNDPMRSAERRVCEALAARLDDRCRAFFGVAWLSPRRDGRLHEARWTWRCSIRRADSC